MDKQKEQQKENQQQVEDFEEMALEEEISLNDWSKKKLNKISTLFKVFCGFLHKKQIFVGNNI